MYLYIYIHNCNLKYFGRDYDPNITKIINTRGFTREYVEEMGPAGPPNMAAGRRW